MAAGKVTSLCRCMQMACNISHFTRKILANPQLFLSRSLSTCSILEKEKRPRVLPTTHVFSMEHNSQYFTPYPQLTREEMEEPPPRVSDEVRELLLKKRPRYEGTRWVQPRIRAWQYRKKRNELILAGHYFPDLPMRDRMLDPMPKVKKRHILKEERAKKIEENMRMMPTWIAEYRQKKRDERLKKKEDAEQNKVALMQIEKLGLHPKDPRAKQILGESRAKAKEEEKKKKKFGKKKEVAA